jgi:hypothetical protein
MIDFLDQIRHVAFEQSRDLALDLRGCTHFSVEVTPLIAAELQRIRFFRGTHAITGISPSDQDSRRRLHATGFFDFLNLLDPAADEGETGALMEIRSGTTLDGEVTLKLAVAFAEALDLEDSQRELVQRALNEALENISEHAYSDDLSPSYPAEDGRWWVSVLAPKSGGSAYLLACDLGLTIPATVPRTAAKGGSSNLERLAELLRRKPNSKEEALLAAAFEEGVTRRPGGKGGRGLGKMAQLAEEFPGGSLTVWSGGAVANITSSTNVDTLPLPRRFAGTYVLWHLEKGVHP